MQDTYRSRETGSFTKNLLYTTGFLAAATGIGYIFHMKEMQDTNIVLLYIVAVFLTARCSDQTAWGIVASVAATFAFNFFFTEPLFTFSVSNTSYVVTFVCMTLAAMVTSSLTMKVKQYAKRTLEKERDIHALYVFTSELSGADTIEKIERIARESISSMFGRDVSFRSGGGVLEEADVAGEEQPRPMERFTVRGGGEILGLVEIDMEDKAPIPEGQRTLLNTMLENIGSAMDRVKTAEERYRSQKLMEQEKYRANLLRGISHDLRTPLMGIMGTAEMIDGMSEEEDPRKQLARDIYQDADWLHSLVENILGLTRLHDGNSLLNKTPEPLEEIISSAIKRVEKRAMGYEICLLYTSPV